LGYWEPHVSSPLVRHFRVSVRCQWPHAHPPWPCDAAQQGQVYAMVCGPCTHTCTHALCSAVRGRRELVPNPLSSLPAATHCPSNAPPPHCHTATHCPSNGTSTEAVNPYVLGSGDLVITTGFSIRILRLDGSVRGCVIRSCCSAVCLAAKVGRQLAGAAFTRPAWPQLSAGGTTLPSLFSTRPSQVHSAVVGSHRPLTLRGQGCECQCLPGVHVSATSTPRISGRPLQCPQVETIAGIADQQGDVDGDQSISRLQSPPIHYAQGVAPDLYHTSYNSFDTNDIDGNGETFDHDIQEDGTHEPYGHYVLYFVDSRFNASGVKVGATAGPLWLHLSPPICSIPA